MAKWCARETCSFAFACFLGMTYISAFTILARDLAFMLLVLAVVPFVAMAATFNSIFFASASAAITGTRLAVTFIGSEIVPR